eukprot:CAMPEP_0115349522 /NCGR_PEP_ID=MMETSP0270-20121206/95971_1 /TAXON_ID=71861 /ORGANISM="Scrippsiella trochoidea, Strain CCMP3099" /LENGTH=75 /DNA_ID=CAMNT_0002771541 /DNA_START=17 /DNA_END=240 /DNA_ORIENTATION=-
MGTGPVIDRSAMTVGSMSGTMHMMLARTTVIAMAITVAIMLNGMTDGLSTTEMTTAGARTGEVEESKVRSKSGTT